MNDFPVNREKEIFEHALELSSEERQRYLEEACAGDATLLADVQELLEAHEASLDFLPEEPRLPPGADLLHPAEHVPGDMIGPYKLREKIGEGGWGVVYVADQEEPVRRRVALKLVKLGMDTRQVVARFEAERQALAMMEHPGIARVFDAGATETGRPYFVMELVRGIKITAYCDQARLDTRSRLELFIQVCHAVQHAHQKGIIHRDLKPSNILITQQDGAPVPKVIDFGIAKATEGKLTDLTVYSAFHQFMGTPAYMSPEQASMSGQDIDTRTDIYSLGVLLYELLTGRPPFDPRELADAGIEEICRTIREREPERPSTKLSTLAKDELTTTAVRRSIDPPRLTTLLRGDLDWIAMKCLEKDRTRRYDTANGLAMDVERHLNNEPVLARPPSAVYRLRKTWRRNKVAFTAGLALLSALVAGIVGTNWQRVEAQAARLEAEEARRHAEQQERMTRRQLYSVDMNLAQLALEADNRRRAVELLDRNRPAPGEEDLRHWEWNYLWTLSRSDELFTLGVHSNRVYAVAVSPDGTRVISGGLAPVLRVWDLPARKQIAALPQESAIYSLAYSPDGQIFASGDTSGIRVWNANTFEKVADLSQPDLLRSLAFSPDAAQLASFCRNGTVTIWECDTWEGSVSFWVPGGGILQGAVTFSPDGSIVAASGEDGGIVLADPRTGETMKSWFAHQTAITALSFSPDNRLLASSSWDRTVRLWRLPTGEPAATLAGHSAWVSAVAFSPAGLTLASASADQTIRLWDGAAGEELAAFAGHTHEVGALVFAPDGQSLITGGKDDAVKVWPVKPKQMAAEGPRATGIRHFWFLPEPAALLVKHVQGYSFLDPFSGQELGRFVQPPPGLPPHSLAVSPARPLAAWPDPSGVIRVWNLAENQLEQDLPRLPSHVERLQFSGDGHRLGVAQRNGKLSVWDIASGARALSTDIGSFSVGWSRCVFSPGLNRFAFVENRQVHLAKLDLPGVVALLGEHRDSISSIAFAPDGGSLATACEDGEVKLWDTDAGAEVAVLQGDRLGLHSIAFSPDGRRLAAGCGDATARLWDLDTMQELLSLQIPVRPDRFAFHPMLEFAPNGNALGALVHGHLHVWHVPSLDEIAASEADPGFNWMERAQASPRFAAIMEPGPGNPAAELYNQLLSLNLRGRTHSRQGDYDKAEKLFLEALETGRKLWNREHPTVAETLRNLGDSLTGQGRYSEAEPILRQAAAMQRKIRGDDHPRLAVALNGLARACFYQGNYSEAEVYFREALEIYRNAAGDWQEELRVRLHNLSLLLDQEKHAEAERFGGERLELQIDVDVSVPLDVLSDLVAGELLELQGDPSNPDLARTVRLLADLLSAQGNHASAEPLLRQRVDRLRQDPGNDERGLAGALAQLALNLLTLKQFVEAEPPARESLEIRERAIPDDWRTFNARALLGRSLLGQNRYDEAEPLLIAGYEGMRERDDRIPVIGRPRIQEALQALVQLYQETGRPEKAGHWKQKGEDYGTMVTCRHKD
jgi:eukaryotic-like serine/threonine-protein kinase